MSCKIVVYSRKILEGTPPNHRYTYYVLGQEPNPIEIKKKPNVFVMDHISPNVVGNENMPSHLGSKFMCKRSNILYTLATPFLRMRD